MEPRKDEDRRVLPQDPVRHDPYHLVPAGFDRGVQPAAVLLLPHLQDQREEGRAGHHRPLQ